ncbi:hypothetical protein [Paractinoplanes maris]|uniref:hypothetical protein n=1 Tax=Paractinoplanes maris TaxID=1734446 RepID=UPI00202192F8|nr:hypothetical protein [Actinoplanes maris]
MAGYADPEIVVGEWLRDTLDAKVWVDPKPPANAWTTAPWLWVQRAPSGFDMPLTLDDVLLDCNAYAAEADHARDLGQRVWAAMTLTLPRHTFANGLFVTRVKAEPAPFWAPDPQYRRSASYRVVLHGLI